MDPEPEKSGRRSSLNIFKSDPGNYHVPNEVKQRLTDFAVAYLVYQPQNIYDFGEEFFQRLKEQEDISTGANDEEVKAGFRQGLFDKSRRKTVCAEPYDPEEDKDFKIVVHHKSSEQKERILKAIKHNLLFRGLDQQQMKQVLNAMSEKKVIPGEIIIAQGDDGDNFYVIEEGQYSVLVESDEDDPFGRIVVGTYENEGSFGELALMYNQPRTASVRADSHGILWVMDRFTFRKIVLKTAFMKVTAYEELLEKVPMFNQLNNYEKIKLADALVSRTYYPNQVIIHQGDKADGMFFVENGTVLITHEQGGIKKQLNRIEPGGYFGELALLTSKRRAATVTAESNVKVAFLDVDAFERLLGPCLKIMKRNAASYDEQLTNLFGSKADVTDIRWM